MHKLFSLLCAIFTFAGMMVVSSALAAPQKETLGENPTLSQARCLTMTLDHNLQANSSPALEVAALGNFSAVVVEFQAKPVVDFNSDHLNTPSTMPGVVDSPKDDTAPNRFLTG